MTSSDGNGWLIWVVLALALWFGWRYVQRQEARARDHAKHLQAAGQMVGAGETILSLLV